MNPDQLEQALHALFEGQLESEALAELNEELRSNPAAREAYRESQMLEHCLRYRSKGTDLTKVVPMEQIVRRHQRKAMQQALMASAAVLAIGMLTLMLIMGREDHPTLSFKLTPGAEVSLSHDLGRDEPPGGQAMEPGSQLKLASGSVELEFKSGVRAVIQGPANLSLERENLLRLEQGVAWFDVPANAVGFQVITQDLVLTDLGTRFGILSRPKGQDQVHVFKGKVEVLSRGPAKGKETLTTGLARSTAPDGTWQETKLNPDIFLKELPISHSPPVQLVDSARFSSSPNNEILRGPYLFSARHDLANFNAQGANKLIVTISHENGRIAEVTYEGLRLTQAAQSSFAGNLTTAIYYLDSPPATGNLEIRVDGRCNGVGGSIFALASAQRGKPPTTIAENGSSASLNTRASNSLVIASLVTNQQSNPASARAGDPMTLHFNGPTGSSNGASAYALIPKPRRLDISFKTEGASPALAAVVIHPSP